MHELSRHAFSLQIRGGWSSSFLPRRLSVTPTSIHDDTIRRERINLRLFAGGCEEDRSAQRSVAKEWERIEPLLADNVVDAGERIAGDGFYEALTQLSPRLRGDARRRQLVIEKWFEHDYTLLSGDELTLAPSVYVWPHLAVFLLDGAGRKASSTRRASS